MALFVAVPDGPTPGVFDAADERARRAPNARAFSTADEAALYVRRRRGPTRVPGGVGSVAHTQAATRGCVVEDARLVVRDGLNETLVSIPWDCATTSREAADLTVLCTALAALPPGAQHETVVVTIDSAFILSTFLPRRALLKRRRWLVPIAERDLCMRLSSLLDSRPSVLIERPQTHD